MGGLREREKMNEGSKASERESERASERRRSLRRRGSTAGACRSGEKSAVRSTQYVLVLL